MVETNSDQAAQRGNPDGGPGHDSAAAPSRETANPSTNTITVCAWCPGLNILKLERRYTDVVIIVATKGKPLKITAFLNGEKMLVSHGMCRRCRAEKFPETVKGPLPSGSRYFVQLGAGTEADPYRFEPVETVKP